MHRTRLILTLALFPAVFAVPIGCGVVLGLDEYKLASGGAGGGDASAADLCVPAKKDGSVDDSCGVFLAASGEDTGAGTKLHPVATFKTAIERAKAISKPIYACAEEIKEAVVVPSGITIYGGLACGAGWVYVGFTQKTEIRPEPGEVPLKLLGGDGTTHLEDIAAIAADAVTPGGSSIAAVTDSASAELVRCALVAGNGMDGAMGATPPVQFDPLSDDPAIRGNNGADACMGGVENPGGPAKVNPFCSVSVGGAGGNSTEVSGGNGEDGQPMPKPPDGSGLGGKGAGVESCKSAKPGLGGLNGSPGAGAASDDFGLIDASGYIGAVGKSGAVGAPGQGGGGGGGGKGKLGCNGPSAASGGAGGCGGEGGLGGDAGGASIALVNLSSSLAFDAVILQSAIGGKGGEGGYGQGGGLGGLSGSPGKAMSGTTQACSAGGGGNGGGGGKGGGGRGGHSIGIAYKGSPPSTIGATIQIGVAGEGGLGEGPSGNGAPGIKADIKAFQ